nr:MAG TPA: hypothetical protein [Caudoviricetes sp.]
MFYQFIFHLPEIKIYLITLKEVSMKNMFC